MLSPPAVSLSNTDYTYSGTAKEPVPTVVVGSKTLEPGTDYTVSYENNTDAGTGKVVITGMGNYTGSTSKEFSIAAKPLSSSTVTLSKTSYVYSGSARKPSTTVKSGSKTLKLGTDYTVSYKNNTNAGTATVTITGKGNYKSTAKVTFTITKAANPLKVTTTAKTAKLATVKTKAVSVSTPSISGAKGAITYAKASGSGYLSINKTTGKVSVKKGTKAGTYTIKVMVTAAGNSNYKAGSKTVTVKITVK